MNRGVSNMILQQNDNQVNGETLLKGDQQNRSSLLHSKNCDNEQKPINFKLLVLAIKSTSHFQINTVAATMLQNSSTTLQTPIAPLVDFIQTQSGNFLNALCKCLLELLLAQFIEYHHLPYQEIVSL